MLFSVLILPLTLIAGIVYLLVKKRYRGLGLGLALFLTVLAAGWWAILQSHSSTAAIGILFLPFYGAFAGVIGWLSANLRLAEGKMRRGLGWALLVAAFGVPAFLVFQGFGSISLNAARDAKYKADSAEIARNKAIIEETLARQPGRESEAIAALIGEHPNDRNFLLPALESKFVSPATLDAQARSDDLGIALSAIRNPNCRPETLARIYRTHAYPDYFFQALAAHRNTPPEILTELYRRPATIMGLDRSFARNPATPGEILIEIAASTKESYVVQQLLQNPKLDCALTEAIEAALKRSERPDDSFSIARIAALKSSPCLPVKQ
jgi:hypothetical protein